MTKRKNPEDYLPMGRPTDYNAEMAALICERVATHSVGLRRLCEMYEDLPSKFTINLWRYKYPDFSSLYAKAKLIQADLLAEECIEIADDSSRDTRVDELGNEICDTEWIARCRLRIDTRKWMAAKLLPKQYGKAVDEHGPVSETLVDKLLDRLVD